MKIIEQVRLKKEEKFQITKLWNAEYPKTLNFSDDRGFDIYLNTLSDPKHYLLINENVISGWATKFVRDDAIWFAIILDEKIQGKGHGSALLDAIKKNEKTLNAWVIDKSDSLKANSEFYKSPLGFYVKHGFKIFSEIRLETDKMSAVKITWDACHAK